VSVPIPATFYDLFSRPILCALTTIDADGHPHTVPVWVDYEAGRVRFNAPVWTKKARNLTRNDKLSLLIIDPQNPDHWIEIQGRVGEIRGEAAGAREHINKLSEKYTGSAVYEDGSSKRDRQMYVVEAVKINGY
jgi:PPOX class probable F420-dependent enzyme